MPVYDGINGVVRKRKEWPVGIDGVVRQQKEHWAGINGVNRQIFSSVTGKQAGEYAIGDTVYLNENGQNTAFIVSAQNYESTLNGNGRTLLVRGTWWPTAMAWGSNNGTIWSQASLDTWLNTTYLGYFDVNTQSAIGVTKFLYYSSGSVYPFSSATIDTLERSVFILSDPELGLNFGTTYADGSTLENADTLKTQVPADTLRGVWTRTPYRKPMPYAPDNIVCQINQSPEWGTVSYPNMQNCYPRPCFTIAATTLFNPDTNIIL